ncbi:hypothetical protein Cgig2_024854 [Carnegiea gigantea]|uniref:ZF-HD dimerization-type domain-containing protein n=1 Tax=Carnegiea gigantea TaxID=171969 RepID=A0A9Q1QGI7_9CARY|nr:hypothetical protein Cgig2_024854 [Carnegiea gigantea]
MDLTSSPTTPGAAPARAPDSDTDTPPTPQPTMIHNHRHAPSSPTAAAVSYKECLRNHAASSGGHALDGCCEFMPGPTFNPTIPTSLKCAACGCHRNFHRRDPDDPAPLHHHLPAAVRRVHSPSPSQLLLSLSGQSPSGPSDEMDPRVAVYFNGNSKQRSRKRYRTKFSQEQKEKMQEFAERIGWRLRRGEERLVEEFCRSVGVERGVFKVWMHNNKNHFSSIKREKEHHQSNGGINNGNCGGVVYHEFYANVNGGAQEAHVIAKRTSVDVMRLICLLMLSS